MARKNDAPRPVPVGREYEGPAGIGRESPWLTHEDLIEGRDLAIKIEKVLLFREVEFEGGRKRKNLLGLKFVGKERVLGLNATNRKVLTAMYGGLAVNWKDKEITLFVTETEAWGDTVKCLRIRKVGARAMTTAEQLFRDTGPDPIEGASRANGTDVNDPAARERMLLEDDGAGERGEEAGA